MKNYLSVIAFFSLVFPSVSWGHSNGIHYHVEDLIAILAIAALSIVGIGKFFFSRKA